MTSSHLTARIHSVHRAGRPMTLRRQTTVSPVTFVDVALKGHMWAYRPEQLNGGIIMGDAQVEILDLEIAVAGWPGPPRVRDQLVVDGRTLQVVGSRALYDGDDLIGHELWVRG